MRPLSASYFDLLTENAVVACDKALALDAKHPRAGLVKGQALADPRSKHHNPDLAGQVLEQDLQHFPGRIETVLALCQVYESKGDAAAMERAARAGLAQAPKDARLRVWLGKALWKAGSMGAAADQFKQAASADPKSFEAVQLWAAAAGAARTPPDELLKALEAHGQAHPTTSIADEVRAGVQKDIGRDDDALATLAGLIQRFPDAKKAKDWALMRVEILARKANAADAFVEAVCAVWKVDPKNDAAWEWFWPLNADRPEPLLVRVRRLGEWARGVAVAERVGAAITGDADSETWAERKAMCYWVAWECHMNLGAHAASEAAIRKAIELDGRRSHYHNALGLLLRYLGRTDEAIAAFRAALERQINLPWAWENLGATYLAQGQTREAREALTQGLAWAREDEAQYDDSQPEQLQAAQFESWKLRRLLIDAWRLEAAGK
jgi:tetratricopeptide (TPR) repeat protein